MKRTAGRAGFSMPSIGWMRCTTDRAAPFGKALGSRGVKGRPSTASSNRTVRRWPCSTRLRLAGAASAGLASSLVDAAPLGSPVVASLVSPGAVASCSTAPSPDVASLAGAVEAALRAHGVTAGEIAVAAVDDSEIHELNRRFLQHDYPTDVITFPHERGDAWVLGDIVFSAEYAAREAAERGVDAVDEMMLYVIHGALHLAGFDDRDDESRAAMRAAERAVFASLGKESPFGDDDSESAE